MKLSSLKIFAIKLGLFSSILLYLGIDLLWWHGPVWGSIYSSAPGNSDEGKWVAEVYGEKISEKQLLRYEAEQDLLTSRKDSSDARKASRLMDLVRDSLLRIRTRYNDKNLPPMEKASQEAVERLASRYPDEASFEKALASLGYSKKQYTEKLETRMRAQAQLERAVSEAIQVKEEEIERRYEQIKGEVTVPASRRVRHIFLALNGALPEEVEKKASDLLARLQEGADFAALAREYSEDERSAPLGGDLGVISDDSLRLLPELPLFGEHAIPSHIPTLAKSKWGWHILAAEDITPARALTLEECRESIRTAILSALREQAVEAYFQAALREGFHKKRIKIHVQ